MAIIGYVFSSAVTQMIETQVLPIIAMIFKYFAEFMKLRKQKYIFFVILLYRFALQCSI